MNLSTWSTFFIPSIFIMIAASATLSTKDYVKLISDIYNLHKASSLTLIHFIDREDISQMNTIFNVQILLSRARIMTVTLNLEEGFLPNDYTKSLRYVKKPMNVIFITCESDVNKIKELSKELNFYGVTNLILFMKAFKSPLVNSCMNPVGNPFLLSESFSFFVKCYEDFAVREWHASSKNQLTIYERVTWEPTRGLVPKSKKLMQSVSDILNGKVLRIERYSILQKFHKYLNDLSLALELAGNFTTKNVGIEDFGIGSWNTSSKTWSGTMGRIENNEIDIIDFVGNNPRLLLLSDFTMSITLLEVCLCIRKPTSEVAFLWSGYFKPFTYKTWCALIVYLIVTVTLLTFLRFKVEKGSYHGGISQNFLHVWGCYVQQGLPEFPKALALRLFYYSTFLFGFLIFAIYSASFVSELTVLQERLPFKSIEEFLNDRSYRLAAGPFLYDYHTTDPVWIEMKKKLIPRDQSPRNDQDAINLICSRNIAFLAPDCLSFLSVDTNILCNLVKIHLPGNGGYRMYLPKNSPYKEAINYHITKLREIGILKRIRSKFLDSSSSSKISSINAPTEQKYQPVTVLDIASLLAMLCGSVVLSILILFFEKVYFTFCQRNSVQIPIRTSPGAARFRILN